MRIAVFPVLSVAVIGASTVARIAAAQDEPSALAGVGDAADAAELVPAAAAGLPPFLPGEEAGARQQPPHDASAKQEPALAPRLTGEWAGFRLQLEQSGVELNGSLVTEWSAIFAGGVSGAGKSAFRHLLDVNAAFDLERIAGVQRARAFLCFQNGDAGVDGAQTGAWQAYSNIAIDGSITQVSQAWYEQWFGDDLVRVKLGKVDANSEFAFIGAAAGFINASAGFSPAVFALPTYPNPATSVNVFVYPTKELYAGVGVYDGAAAVDGVQTGSLGPSGFFSDSQSDDWFVIGECGVTAGDARVAAGAWWHSGDFTRYSGGTEDGTAGAYALAEARVWAPEGVDPADADDQRGLRCFLQCGFADPEVSAVASQFGAGAVLAGTFPNRDDDTVGIYASLVDFSDELGAGYGASEFVLELSYDIAITPWLHAKPDLQWFSNPADGGDDALVGTIRFTIAF